ncbi:MAG: hypothetical protein JWM53_5653 [bacterium]|nr:hypothetical protein [bacterium]
MRNLTGPLSMSLLLVVSVAAGGCGANPDGSVAETTEAFTARKGVDYSFARPSPSGLHSQGYSFAARYLSYDNSSTHGKILTAGEANGLIGAGVDVVSNWEYGATDALGGYNAGVNDAKAANAQAAAAGAPANRPIYFSVDFDATPADQTPINAYLDGAASVIGRSRVGAYGGYYVIKRAFDAGKIAWGWQTYAWSGGQWDARAQLRQTQNGITAAGDANCCDLDQSAADDFGQWGHAPPWAAKYVSQSWPLAGTAITLKCGESLPANIVLRNAGSNNWDANTKLGTTQPRDRASRFVASNWQSASRPSHVTGTVGPNGTFQFNFTFQGPTGAACVPGQYHEFFGVVQEGVAWFSDAGQGGPADNDIEAFINLVPGAPPPDMAHAPGADMAHQPGADLAGVDEGDLGTVAGDDAGATDDFGDGTGGNGSGGGGGVDPQPHKGCSFGGDAGGAMPLASLGLVLLLVAWPLRRRSR